MLIVSLGMVGIFEFVVPSCVENDRLLLGRRVYMLRCYNSWLGSEIVAIQDAVSLPII